MANELFDAVLSGSMDKDKKAVTQVAPSKAGPTELTQSKKNTKLGVPNKEPSGKPGRKVSVYVGNFPWVSNTVCAFYSLLILMLFL